MRPKTTTFCFYVPTYAFNSAPTTRISYILPAILLLPVPLVALLQIKAFYGFFVRLIQEKEKELQEVAILEVGSLWSSSVSNWLSVLLRDAFL
jgi:hypothetical protein